MLKIKSLNNLAGISRQPAGGNSAWHNRHRMTGWVGLILVSLLIFSTSPASASDANSNLAGAPTPFNKSDPANNATDQPLNLTLDWNNSQFATSYDYCIDATIDSGCTSPATWTSSGMNSYVDLTSLSGSTTYEWQVRANNIDGTTYANSGNWWTFTTTVAPPGTFSKSSPANNATGQAINSLTLSWGASSGATSYEYCYDSTLDNDCTGWTTNPDTDVVINGLSYATQYEWQVRAVNSNPVKTYADSDTWWYFTTSNAPPGSFSKSSPADDATGQPLSLTLTWGSSSGASSYEYCYDTTVDDTCAGSWTSTELLYANISVGTYDDMFEWQVRAVNGSGTTDADGGSWWQFTTMADPGGFLKSSPGDGSLGQSPSATISWAAYGGATSYDYCYDTDIDGDCDGTWTTNGTATSKELTLDYDNEYEWQVRVWPGEVYADGGSWWTFTTYEAQPGSFSKTDPDNGELNQALSLTLTWAESTDATSYRYCIDSNLEAGHVGVCDASWIPVANNSAEISGLSYNDTYEWQVRAYNDNPNYTNADSGAWHQFTTVVPPPGSFLKISPLDDAVNRSINLTLDWGTSSSATEYEYCIDVTIDQECTSPSEWTSVGTNTEVTLYGLSYDTEYEWQARALNANPIATEADSDIWWTFITMPEAPGAFLKTSPVDTVEGVDPTTSITLEWEESDRAETYWYCIDSLTTPPNDQTCNGIWTLTDSSTSTDISDLLYGTQYEWQIRAENANPLKTEADGGDYHLFTTIVMPPGDFNKSGPTAGAPDQPINLTLDWGDSNAATDYQYCIDAETVPDGTCESGWQSIGGTTSQIALTNLSYATLYEWQVRADNDYPGETYADSGTWWTFTTVVAPPGAFNKTSPAHDSKDLAPSLIPLQWGASTGADSYSYCIDSTINSACNGSWTSTGSNTSVDLPPLDFNTQYEWQVKALNANPGETYANANIWFTFTTRVGTYPGDFSKQYPLEFAVDIPTNPTLQWAASSNATRYEYCYDNVVNGACTTWVNNGTSRQVTISTPELNKQYEWHVRAWNDTEGPTYSNSLLDSFWTFTTVKVNPPTPFGKTSPASGTTGLLPPDLALTWGASTNVSTYEYCYDTVRNNTCDSEWTSTIDTGVDISDLVFGKQYEWQVRAFRDDNPNPTPADGGTWWTFATVATQPGAFNKSEPINLAVDRPIALTLVWGASTGAASYEYCVEPYDGNDTCEGDNWLSPVPVTNNNVNISGLSYGTKYSWQVRAVNANPTMTYANAGAWYQFTTAIAPPGAFSKISPANGAVNQLLSLVLSWQASPGATSYAYCYDATVNSSCSGTWTATTATSASISGLNYATGYEWHVRATNLTGTTYSNSNTLWTFTTVDNPAGAFSKTNPVAGASGQPIDPTLTWEESSGAIEYQYCIDTTPDSVCDGDAWVSSGTLRIADLTGLAYLTTYQWQVRAKSDNPNWTQANSGTWRLFTTQVSPPDPFDKISPAHEAPNQPNRPYLSWGASNGATGYAYCIDTTLNGGCDGSWVPTSLLYAYVSSPELAYGTPYEWQVKAINDTGETEANEGDSPEWWTFTVKAEPTNSKANPDDGYFNQPVDLEINWTSMSDVEYYEYCYDASVNDACLDESWTATPGLTTYANLTGLINGETYEWQVRGYDEDTTSYFYANSGEWWTFSIVQTAPGDFSKSSPSHPSSGQPANDLTLSWDTSSDATGYRYCLDTNQNETCNTSWVTVGSGTTSVDVSNLVYGANYEWQVLASNNNPNMTEANDDETPEWWTFTVINAPPEPFNKLTPADNALDQLINLNLSWQAAVGATSGYQYCIDDTLDSTCDGDAWLPATPPSNTTVAISALENDTPYEWQVRAYSANSYEPTLANGGNWHTFTTVVSSPQDFNKISPATGITWLPTELMISWEESPGATGYEYCVDDQPGNAACDGVWLETSLTQALISGLINQTEYEWHVRAVNANPVITESDSGSWFNFSTIPLHSYLPVLLKAPLRPPVLNPVTIGPGNTYTLTWSADAQATSFKIWESLTTTFPTDPTYETTTASLTLPANKNPTRYYYYVIASAGTKSSLPSNILAVDRQYELEDNDSSPTANGQIFTNVEYHGHPDDQKDYYKFYMSGSGTITVTMTDFPTSWPGQLQLLDDSLRALSWDVNPYDGMKVTLYSATAKWYYIYIATDPSGYSSNWYDFTVTVTH